MDIVVPLTLETVRLVAQMCPENFKSAPEDLYNFFYKELSYTCIYIPSDGEYYFTSEAELEGCYYVPLTIEEARETLFIRSLET